MRFITVADDGFRTACRAKRGELRRAAHWEPFVTAFAEHYGFAPLWLDLDDETTRRPCLTVVLERTAQHARFAPRPLSVDHGQLRVVRRLLQRTAPRLRRGPGVRGLWPIEVDANSLAITFADFERLATEQTHTLVTATELRHFEQQLAIGDAFWCTSRLWGPPTVFVHTEAQAAVLRVPQVLGRFADRWFEAAVPHDEFGYLTRESVVVGIDSKENFDRNYAGNWYFYYT